MQADDKECVRVVRPFETSGAAGVRDSIAESRLKAQSSGSMMSMEPKTVTRLRNFRGVGGVVSTYTVSSEDGTESLDDIQDRDDAIRFAEFLAIFTESTWSVVEHKGTHETIAAYGLVD